MTLKETCNDCEWEETWEGGTAAEDPSVQHAKETGHTVSSFPCDQEKEVSYDDELSEIPDRNHFKPVIQGMRNAGAGWGEIYDELETALDAVDPMAFEEVQS